MQNNDDAKYLENVVKQRDLFAFACEDKDDMSDLINELCVKQKLGVNIIYCAPADRCLYNPSIPKSELRYVYCQIWFIVPIYTVYFNIFLEQSYGIPCLSRGSCHGPDTINKQIVRYVLNT